MPKKLTFTATIQNADGGGAFVEVPAELKKAFKVGKEAQVLFEKLAYSHQREYVTWITEAKREETRQARIVKTIELLKKGRKTR